MYRIYRTILVKVVEAAMKFYVEWVAGPWLFAKLHVAWEEYQQDSAYRQRTTIMGFEYALNRFLDDRLSRGYLYRRAIEKDPMLKWRVWFRPWSIPVPAVLETAACEGFFNEEER